MALLSGSLASLINGVSQQPPWMRLPSQAEAQENAVSSLVDGVKRRPAREHIARLSATSYGNAHIHTINRDPTNRYVVVITNGDLKVYDLTGAEKTVNFPNGKAYLSATDPKMAFTTTTLADFTFVVNKEVTVTETNAGNTVGNTLFAYVKQSFYNASYGVYIDGTLVGTYTTGASGTPPTPNAVAAGLEAGVAAGLGAGWTVTLSGSVIAISKDDGTTHTIGGFDSQSNTALVTFGRSIQNFVDLPPFSAPDGTTVEVNGSPTNEFDSYWVKYNATKRAWEETVKPEDESRPTPATMPWKLTRELDGTWTFDKIDWGWRKAGDVKTAPKPSLIGRKINDILVHRNRLFILADQNVLSSRPGGENFFELYPKTVTTTLDSDPIDVGLSSDSEAVPFAKFGVPFNEDLLICTEPGQFRLGTGDQLLTSATVKATQVASYTSQLTAKPAVNGKLLHFAIEKGSNSGVREGFVDNKTNVFDAPDITVHVPSYIAGTITRLCAAINRDSLFVLADGDESVVWVYKWFLENDTKLQSSWSKWLLPTGDKVLDLAYMNSSLYLIIERSTGVFLERLPLDEAYTDDGLDFAVRLDRKVALTGTYDPVSNWTTWTLPYDLTGLSLVGAFGKDFEGKEGFEMPALTVSNATAGTLHLAGDHSAGHCYFGTRYTTLYRLSTISVTAPSPDGKGRSPITDGRLQLRNIYVNYGTTGFLRALVTSPGRPTFAYTFQPFKIGQTLVVGDHSLPTGRFRVPVHARNSEVQIDITSDSHYPCALLSIDWEGEFTLRSRRT